MEPVIERRFESLYLAQIPYAEALARQNQEIKNVKETSVARVLGLEHPSVITLGKRASIDRDLKRAPSDLEALGIELQNIERGGEATLHSPGQLVIYPLVPLIDWQLGVREFVEALTEVTAATLQTFGISTHEKSKEPGLYTDTGKIAFFGIRVERGVSSHGLALNVRNDLDLFSNIVSCGIEQEKFDSLINHDINASPLEVFERWTTEFRRHFILTCPRPRTNLTESELRS